MKVNKKWLLLFSLTLVIQGKVLSFNGKWVELMGTDGKKKFVPRRCIVKNGPLEEDKSVTAELSLKDLRELVGQWPGRVTFEQSTELTPRPKKP